MLVAAKEKVRIIEEERTKKLRGNEQAGDTSAQVRKRAPTPTRTPQLQPAIAVAASHAIAVAASHDQTRTQFPSATTATASIARASTAHLHNEEPVAVAVVETAAVNKDVNLNSSYHARTLAASASTPSSGAETAYFNRPVAQASDMSKSINISLNSSYHARMLSSLALSGNTSAMNALLMYHQGRYGRPQYRYHSGITAGAPGTMAVNTSPPEFKLKSPYAVAASFSMNPTSGTTTTTQTAPTATATDSRVYHNHTSFPRVEFPSSGTISIAQEIERLKLLRDEGTLTEEEFQIAKNRVLMGL